MTRARTLWEAGDEPAQAVALLGVALAFTALVVDLLIAPGVGAIYDVAFVALCVLLALRVRRDDFTLIVVLPPALMLVTFWAHALTADSGTAQELIRSLSEHVGALALGYALFLVLLLVRHEFLRRRSNPAPR